MGVTLYQEPQLRKPDLVASWSGIGNIGLVAVDTLRNQLSAEALGEVEPWDFFYPRKVRIKSGLLEDLEFPASKFYYKRLENRDILFFVGEEQPAYEGKAYAEGEAAYELASVVLDVAQKFGCRRVYTSGAAVALTHHMMKAKVWSVATSKELLREVKGHENTILMSEVEGRSDQGSITGLNGLLLGIAKKRGLEAICLMGEIPDYLSGAPFPYPKASKAVLEVLTKLLGVEVNFGALDQMGVQVSGIIDDLMKKLPPEIIERIEQRKQAVQPKPETITEEDARWIKEHIGEFFKRGGPGERPT